VRSGCFCPRVLYLSGAAKENSPAPAASMPIPCTVLYTWLKDAARPRLAHVGGFGGLEQPSSRQSRAPRQQGDLEANAALNGTPTFAAPCCHQQQRTRKTWSRQSRAEKRHPSQARQSESVQGSSSSWGLWDTSAEAAA